MANCYNYFYEIFITRMFYTSVYTTNTKTYANLQSIYIITQTFAHSMKLFAENKKVFTISTVIIVMS